MNEELSLEDIKLGLLEVWRKKMVVISATIFATLLGLVVTFHTSADNTYSASTTVYSINVWAGQNNSASQVTSYADIITSKRVCEKALELVGGNAGLTVEDVQQMLGVQSKGDSVLVIEAYSTNSDLAVEVSNAVAKAFVNEATSMAGTDAIRILDSAKIAEITNNGMKNANLKRFIFALAGFGISGGMILCKELLSNEVKTIAQCVGEDEDKILGIVPMMKHEV